MESKKDKKKILIVVLFVLIFISLVGLTYAVFVYSKAGSKLNILSTGSITFTYDETKNGILLEDTMPLDDEVGKKLEKKENFSGYFDFNVSANISENRKINYEISALPIVSENELDPKYVKVYLTDQFDNPIDKNDSVKTFEQLDDSTSNTKAKRLYYGSFDKTDSKKFRLRIWVSKDYPIDELKRKFQIKVNVDAFES